MITRSDDATRVDSRDTVSRKAWHRPRLRRIDPREAAASKSHSTDTGTASTLNS